ncbi:armadillo-type protein [Polychytrium aggregatum]|uniref:armadillo-type protein n=1 Tax=Polychytrium aggregatum TaxID=110093 RepID=UPI0022FF17C2|nr:armadillo-type protein [Polychytrium aggregatum]KAI9205151.1 armadillo-type protein [Polychytrium aggregatum]
MDYPGGRYSNYKRTNNGDGSRRDRFGPYKGNRRSHYYTPPPKTKEEELEERLTSLLVKVGDKAPQTKSNLEVLVTVLEKEYHDNKETILKGLKHCITELPMKTSIYATLTGIVNTKNFDIGGDILSCLSDAMDEALAGGNWRSVKLLLRYFAELVNANVVLPGSLIALYDGFLRVMSEPNPRMERVDAIVYIVLASIPWVAPQLSDRARDDFDRVLQTIEGYVSQRPAIAQASGGQVVLEALKINRGAVADDPYPQLDFLDLLWAQILDLRKDNWETGILLKPYSYFEDLFNQELQHELREFSLPPDSESSRFPYQEPKFWIFDDSLIPEGKVHLPATGTIARFILDDITSDIIHLFPHNHRECANYLLALPDFLNTQYIEEHNYIPLETTIECLYCELVKLPRSQEKSVYYAMLLGNLCRNAKDKAPSIFARALKILYARLDSREGAHAGTDVESIKRLGEWFAHHLSNFGFIWKWHDWEPAIQDPTSAQFVFIRETLERCIRLSYYERVKEAVPESFQSGEFPIFPSEAPAPVFVYEDAEQCGDAETFALATELLAAMNKKKPIEEVEAILLRISRHGSGMSIDNENAMSTDDAYTDGNGAQLVRDVFLQCLLSNGCKSFSHILNIIERYLVVLQKLNRTSEARLHSTAIIANFWRHNTQFLEIVLDKMMNYRVIDPSSIISWVLSEEVLAEHYSRWFIWTTLKNILSKINLKSEQIQIKLAATRNRDEFSTNEESLQLVQTLENSLSTTNREKKEAFILVFQRFIDLITRYIQSMESQGIVPQNTIWWRWVVGNFREVGRNFEKDIYTMLVTLDAVVFTDHIDARITQIWREIKQMYQRRILA